MDANWATIIVSLITGGFGFLGIIVTQLVAKRKIDKIRPSVNDIISSSESFHHLPSIDYLAALKNDIREHQILERETHGDIKEMLRELSHDLREGLRQLTDAINRLER